jgi:hypothetical protein
MHVEHEQPFYALSNLPTYKMRCELFVYNDESFDTSLVVLNELEATDAYTYELTLKIPKQATATANIGVI